MKRYLSPFFLLIACSMALTQLQMLSADDKLAIKQSEPREPAEISRNATTLVRLASKNVDEVKRVKAIVGLCELFVEIGEHPEIEKSVTLQRVSVELQTRLRGIEDRLTKELRRKDIPEPQSMIDAERAKRKSRASSSAIDGNLVSKNVVGGGTSRQSPNSATSDSTSTSSSASEVATAVPSGSTSNQIGLGGGAGVNDIGWWLVDLIRHTVQPDYWDTAGGPGTVVYYGPSRALVIRGSWRIHEEVSDLLSALR